MQVLHSMNTILKYSEQVYNEYYLNDTPTCVIQYVFIYRLTIKHICAVDKLKKKMLTLPMNIKAKDKIHIKPITEKLGTLYLNNIRFKHLRN